MRYLLTGGEMKQWEQKLMERFRVPSILLMERVAQSVVKHLCENAYDLHRVLVVCGTGNNGGDGIAVARRLQMHGVCTEILLLGEIGRMTEETRKQWEMYEALEGKVVTSPMWDEYTVIVDGILGIGCNREVSGIMKEIITQINLSRAKVAAIDIPSGISADTGKVCGVAVKADVTITFFTKKLGMVLYPGCTYCGDIYVEDLEMPFTVTDECKVFTYEGEDVQKLPIRKEDGHKGTFGKVLVIAGTSGMCGAAYFAAAAAYGMGAGIVKVLTAMENRMPLQMLLPEAIITVYEEHEKDFDNQIEEAVSWADVVVIGPGLGTGYTAEHLLGRVLLKTKVPLVIDADGINQLAKDREVLKEKQTPVILTPHIQEMSRLSGLQKQELLERSMEIAVAFTEEYPVTLVLKNARTIVTKQGEPIYLNSSGNSGMATGGSGDVLAGMIGGLLAQGMKEKEAAELGVFLHGKAGDFAAKKKSVYSMTARDLLDSIAEVTRI